MTEIPGLDFALGEAELPEMAAIDLRAEEMPSGRWISPTLARAVDERPRDEQPPAHAPDSSVTSASRRSTRFAISSARSIAASSSSPPSRAR